MELGKTYTYEEFMEQIHLLVEHWGRYLHYEAIGESHDGREIPSILLGDSEKCLILSAGIHGRESVNPILLLRMMEEYCQMLAASPDSKEAQLLTRYSLYFLPLVNPDGYEAALDGFGEIKSPIFRHAMRMRRIPAKEWKYNAKGVDINRNFPCRSYERRAPLKTAASEPETRAVMKAFGKFPQSVGYIDFHSRGRVIYYYRGAMPVWYNRKGRQMAKHLKMLSDYDIGSRREESTGKEDGGNSVHYYSETYGKLAITVETIEDEADFPLSVDYQEQTFLEICRIPLGFLEEYE